MSSVKYWDKSSLEEPLYGKHGTGYWRTLNELAESAECGEQPPGEFPDPEYLQRLPVSRRRVLQLLGASMALAGATACKRQSPEDIVPYVQRPEQQVPGRAEYYATSIPIDGFAHGVLAESHEGRPTKLEGNPDHPATLGACDAVAQAAVLSLYDPDRSPAVRREGTITSYGALLETLHQRQQQWDAEQGRGLCFLSRPVTSPSELAAMEHLRRRWPKAQWFMHDPLDRSATYEGVKQCFGSPLEPVYQFGRADLVLSLDANFLQSQPGALRYARDFMARRKPENSNASFARLYAIESTPTVTGAVAEHRYGMPFPQVEAASRQIAQAMGLAVKAPPQPVLTDRWLQALVEDLEHHKGAALVVPGDQQPASVHAIAHAINAALGATHTLVEYIPPAIGNHSDPPLASLAEAVSGAEVESLVVLGSNPVYTGAADLDFRHLYQRVPWRLHWGEYNDETGQLSHWHVPATHPLEAWGDARAYDGTASLVQPLIQPLHEGKTALQLLAALSQATDERPRELLQEYWRQQSESETFEHNWRRWLHGGVIPDSAPTPVSVSLRASWSRRLPEPSPGAEALILQLQPDVALRDGHYANNGWLQEMPRPITTLTWDNAALLSPQLAKRYKLKDGDIIALTTAVGRAEAPVYVLPGQPEHAVTLALGYGRTYAGRVGNAVGTNAYTLRPSNEPWATTLEALTPTGEHRTLALIQNHHSIEGRDLIRATTLEDYRANPDFAQHPAPSKSLYPEPGPPQRQAEHAWGMAIDLSACIGCNACVTACQAENNIPVVGAEEVARGHDMHWLRVDRYFSGSPDKPDMVFQPVPCMHCENAPCEPVCPVGATQHSADGLNQMVYQRCVGTRYCSQNCPYKVRRFNWFDYTSARARHPARPAVQNPDVTVRSRGVMEKCTYCVQRLNEATSNAEAENRPLADGEVRTACQQSCPTRAISFGDIADRHSQVSEWKSSPLNYGMLEHLNTRPRTTYLAAVRHPNPAMGEGEP
ncbi:Fe-S-cluster-containing hydrogenase [Marinimicrobium locisalis]|uniref:Fe-S-cluster-containing hydrogenase n=1 Tax=Marinimicrobium locisalis TaxID=546022 RepID=UPI003221676E